MMNRRALAPHRSPLLKLLPLALLFAVGSCNVPTAVEYQALSFPGPVEPDDPRYGEQWHYTSADLPAAWGILRNSSYSSRFTADIVVSVIDSGIVFGHDDLDAGIVCTPSPCGYDYNEDDFDPTDPDLSQDWHGTHVSGTIAAETVLTAPPSQGVAGVTFNQAKILPIRIFGPNSVTTEVINDAVRFSVGLADSNGNSTATPARVINMSLGLLSPRCDYYVGDTALYEAIQDAVDTGATVVAASGNCEYDKVAYPAAYDNTIAVGATGADNVLASYSEYGEAQDFVAPGGDGSYWVLSTVGPGPATYGSMQGTSMATPHVAGIAALLYSYEPALTQNEIYTILMESALDLGPAGWDEEYGHGLVQAGAALQYLIEIEEGLPIAPMGAGGGEESSGVQGTQPKGSKPPMSGPIMPPSDREAYDAGTVVVRVTDGAAADPGTDAVVSRLLSEYGLAGARGTGKIRTLTLSSGQEVAEMIEQLAGDPDIQYAQPNYRYQMIR